MGTISHNAIVVTHYDREDTETLRKEVVALAEQVPAAPPFGTEDWTVMVSPVIEGVMNGYASFFIGPDGSKEWWDHSDRGDEFREKVTALLDKARARWVEVRYGELGYDVVGHD